MKLNQITLHLENIANDSKVRVLNVRPSYAYTDGVKSESVSGQSYECLLENQNYEKVSIKTLEQEPVILQTEIDASATPIYIQFKDFIGKFYFSNQTKNWELSCKATAAILVKPKQQQPKQ